MNNQYTKENTTMADENVTQEEDRFDLKRSALILVIFTQGLLTLTTCFVEPSSGTIILWWGILTTWLGQISTHAKPFTGFLGTYLENAFPSADREKHVKWYEFFNIILLVLVVFGIVKHVDYGVSGLPLDKMSPYSLYRPNMFFFILGIVIALLRLVASILAIQCAKAYRSQQYPLQAVEMESETAYQAPQQYGPHQQSTERVV